VPIAPTFCFIDPFGFSGVPFTLVRRILSQPRCEVLITFMANAINRWLEHPEANVREHIVELFGSDEASRIARRRGDRVAALRDLYQRQLSSVARFVRYFEMRDEQDRTIYFLFFAGNHRLGHAKMKEAMWRMDPSGRFRFSDATDPRQPLLLDEREDHSERLFKRLASRFGGRGVVTGKQVREFVEDCTKFINVHKSAALKLGEETGRLRVEASKVDGKPRRRGYPPGCRMHFPPGPGNRSAGA